MLLWPVNAAIVSGVAVGVPNVVINGDNAVKAWIGFDVITTDPTLVLADSPDIPMTSAGDKEYQDYLQVQNR